MNISLKSISPVGSSLKAMKLGSFRAVGVQKIMDERGWGSIVSNIPRFITQVVHEFYANFSDNIVVEGEDQFEKVFVRGHVYEFSPRVISEYLNISIPAHFNFEKYYVLDDVATKLLGYKTFWPKTNVLRVPDLTLKYNGLYKIALSNWYPTNHVSTLSRDFATLLFDIGTGAPVHLGQIIFDLIVLHRCGNNMSYKLPFLALIFRFLEGQKPLQEPNEFLSTSVQPYVFRVKEGCYK